MAWAHRLEALALKLSAPGTRAFGSASSPSPRSAASPEIHFFGDAEVDLRRATVRRGRLVLELSSLELKLLRYFIDHREAVLSRGELLDRVWGYDVPPRSRTVDVHVAALRRKLERDPTRPELIRTIYGLGYKFVG